MTPELRQRLKEADNFFTEQLVSLSHDYEAGRISAEEWLQQIEDLQREYKRRLHEITDTRVHEHHAH